MMADTLWDFAVACYRRMGVAECCLRLQDNASADVNMLLAAAWLAEQGRCWHSDEVRELIARCASWREHCILPLRAVRRHLKDQEKQKGQIDTRALYSQAKTLELDAELQQLHLLHDALQSMALKADNASQADVLAANLQTYCNCIAAAQHIMGTDDGSALLEALRQ